VTQLKKTLFPKEYGQMNIDKMVLKRENDRDKCKSVIKEIKALSHQFLTKI
jgi:hypothetical protein